MSPREIAFIVQPTIAKEANGVTIRRSIGNDRMVLLDPFLLCDHLTIGQAEGDGPVGFPRHPHRGIETVTLVFSGKVRHRDSLGNESEVGAGGVQWMTAGRGIFHEEYLTPVDGQVEALQLWFNLPKSQKMKTAQYVAAQENEVPAVKVDSSQVRLVAGTLPSGDGELLTGPLSGVSVHPTLLSMHLSNGDSVTVDSRSSEQGWVYVISGKVLVGERSVTAGYLGVLTSGQYVQISAEEDSIAVYASAHPLEEPVLQYESIVMNTVEDIQQAEADLNNGTFA